MGLGLAEAIVTAFVTAKNYTVTVNFNNQVLFPFSLSLCRWNQRASLGRLSEPPSGRASPPLSLFESADRGEGGGVYIAL